MGQPDSHLDCRFLNETAVRKEDRKRVKCSGMCREEAWSVQAWSRKPRYHDMCSAGSSTGIASLDTAIGGFPDASLYILEEDEHALYSSLLVKTLLSNFLHSNVPCHYFTQRKFNIHALPSKIQLPSSKGQAISSSNNNQMGIAWRYESIAPIENSLTGNNVAFDFGSLLSSERINSQKISLDLIKRDDISQVCRLVKQCPPDARRIIVEGLLDPKSQVTPEQVPLLLYQLKSLTRNNPKLSVFVTLNSGQLDENTVKVIRGICDCCIEMKSFDRPNVNYPDFDGLLLVHKLHTVNIVRAHKNLHTLDLGFQVKSGRYLSVDTLTLPPDINDRSTACKPSLPKLDF